MGPGPHRRPSPGACAPNVLSEPEWEELSQLPQKPEISLVLRCSSACPASREQPSVSASSHKTLPADGLAEDPPCPAPPRFQKSGIPQPPAHEANGEKPAPAPNGEQPQPQLNEADGEKPESAASQASGEIPETEHAHGASHSPGPTGPTGPTTRNHNRSSTRPTARNRNRRLGRAGGRRAAPRASTADQREGGRRPPNSANYRVGEEGFEPSRPFGHTDLNRARLPFRHPPRAGSKASTTPSALIPRIRSDASSEGRCHGGSSAALRATARGHGRGRLRTGLQV